MCNIKYASHSHPSLHDATLSAEQIDNAVVALEPRKGEETLRTEDILSSIERYGDEVSERALLYFASRSDPD